MLSSSSPSRTSSLAPSNLQGPKLGALPSIWSPHKPGLPNSSSEGPSTSGRGCPWLFVRALVLFRLCRLLDFRDFLTRGRQPEGGGESESSSCSHASSRSFEAERSFLRRWSEAAEDKCLSWDRFRREPGVKSSLYFLRLEVLFGMLTATFLLCIPGAEL